MNLKKWVAGATITMSLFVLAQSTFAALAVTPTGITATATSQFPVYPTVNYGTGVTADLIKRGEYLAKAGDCIACHTNGPNGTPFAGGLPIKTPFGTIYSQNITPDKTTGIGNWTDVQFLRAMKHGIAPDGSYYFPVFPFPSFSKMTDDDVLAIKAYLDVLPPVHQVNIPPDMPIPFRWRFLQFFWRVMFFDDQPYVNDSSRTTDWNRGAYLVQGLGHCGMCHTPINFLGAPKQQYALTGGFVDGFYAPNITISVLRDTPVQDIVDVFQKDKLIGGGNVAGPMLEVNHDSLMYLNQADLEAIATYLKTVKSEEPPKPKASNTVSLVKGKQIYDKFCVGCHGSGAGGAPMFGDKAAWAPLIHLGLDQLYKNAIAGIGGMPPKGACATCSEADVQSAVQYIVSQSGGTVPGAGSISLSATAESPTSLDRGKQVYDQYCSVCHANGQLGAPKLSDQAAWRPRIQQNMDILFDHAIQGYKGMPAMGTCFNCTDADVIAAVKYMVQQSKAEGDYNLW